MLKVRLLTAAVLAPLVLLALFYTSMNQFLWIVIGITALAGWEWSGFIGTNSKWGRLGYVVAMVLLCIAGLFLMPSTYSLLIAAIWWGAAIILVSRYPQSKTALENRWLIGVIGFLVLEPMALAFVELRKLEDGVSWLLYGMCVVWVADTGAYFAGKQWGKRKLAPGVSPGKTIEGIWGAWAASILLVVVATYTWLPEGVNMAKLLLVTLVLVPVSVLGDLTESLFKRISGIKDSGKILPGHGGVLDRIDGLTSALPAFAIAFQVGLL